MSMHISMIPNSCQPESLVVPAEAAQALKQASVDFPSINLGQRRLCDLESLLCGAFAPLRGFMTRGVYESVLADMRLPSGEIWPMPICLDVSEAEAKGFESGTQLALRDREGFMLAVLDVEEVWRPNLHAEARAVFGTDDPAVHPGVREFLESTKPVYLGGKLTGVSLPVHYDFTELRLTPSQTRELFARKGWRRVAGFTTERHLHCAHREMAMAAAREENCSIFLQPPVGMPAPGDVDHFTQVCCCREFTAFFPQNLIALGLLTYAARHAGPREALLQALIRRNYGCTHFMVAEDHADPFAWRENSERFYPTSTAQELVAKHAAETGVGMLPLRRMVYCEERAQYIPADEACRDLHVKELTSTELQRRLEFGLEIPEWFTFPEVAAQLAKTYPPRHKQGFTVFITGLSGAGKSTLAKVLYVKFQEMRDRPVTLLDGDIVRRNLSSELNFSREHRDLNVRRIGFVASEITKNRGIAICAPIAPYAGSRRHNRELISHYGGYVEVFLCTPLSVCETRDRKGIYAKARAGIMKGVTGIDDPYQAPSNADIVLDTSSITPLQAAQEVLLYLSKHGYIKNE